MKNTDACATTVNLTELKNKLPSEIWNYIYKFQLTPDARIIAENSSYTVINETKCVGSLLMLSVGLNRKNIVKPLFQWYLGYVRLYGLYYCKADRFNKCLKSINSNMLQFYFGKTTEETISNLKEKASALTKYIENYFANENYKVTFTVKIQEEKLTQKNKKK